MASNLKYATLVAILDKLNEEAPESIKRYHPKLDNVEDINQARSLSFIHLFLKVKCGLTDFRSRIDYITDGSYDGGLDAYFLDKEKKQLLLIQSKFKTTPDSSKVRSIAANDLIKMDIRRILQGESIDSAGNEFNSKVKNFQKIWTEIPDHPNYAPKVILLGNLKNYTADQIKRLIDYCDYEEFDFEKCYMELLLPLCTATFYDPKEISITIKLLQSEPASLKRTIETAYGKFNVRVLFVPTSEIGRITAKYRNSILKYNPRNYLSLSKNKVNKNIRDSILSNKTNEFALYNNGITILASSFKLSEMTGKEAVGQVIISNPQIINGGQTAYTLSKIWEDGERENLTVYDKEVMIKVIVIDDFDAINKQFIDELSNSTNQQSRVEEADRRSNDKVQLTIQDAIFNEFGFFYERKRGEYYYGLERNFINKELIIDRYDFLRAYMAFNGEPRWARQRGGETLFREENFKRLFNDVGNYVRMFFSYRLLQKLYEINDHENWGNGIRYGKMAVIAAISVSLKSKQITPDNLDDICKQMLGEMNGKWIDFETSVSKYKTNTVLYSNKDGFDYDNYYKGKTIDNDVKEYFSSDLV